MKATGIVRRIDDLGRVVIPKDIRRTMRIHDGDPMEIYLENDTILFRKYSPLSSIWDAGMLAVRALRDNTGHRILLCDRNKIIASSGFGDHNTVWVNRRISSELDQVIIKRVPFDGDISSISICDFSLDTALYVRPIVSDDAIMEIHGALIIVKDTENEIITETIKASTNVAANILTHMIDLD